MILFWGCYLQALQFRFGYIITGYPLADVERNFPNLRVMPQGLATD